MKQLLFTLKPGAKVNLGDYDTRYDADIARKDGMVQLEELVAEIDRLQELLYAASTHSLLIILQGMDTSGKDGTIRHVFSRISPLGSLVHSFKVPTDMELAHDFLWRVHQFTPRTGEIAIFNRSHYEDVLVVRVRNLVPERVWKQRYRQINDFERLLAENNTIILKFFLHISGEEQEKRLLAREQDVTKSWKLSPSDWEERELWDDYQIAYTNALHECNTTYAPWHVVPADRKWFRNLAVAHAVVEALQPYKEDWMKHLTRQSVRAVEQLHAMREQKNQHVAV